MMPAFLRRAIVFLFVGALCFVAGGAIVMVKTHAREKPPPDPQALIAQMREVARLETLDVSLYKKVSFAPDPIEQKTFWGDMIEFAKFTIKDPHGRAIVFADAHLSIDLNELTEKSLHIEGDAIEVKLPPIKAQIELKPGETEVIGSNLDSAQTAMLFDKAKSAFQQQVMNDPELKKRARASAERSLKALLIELGFKSVTFTVP